MGVKITNNASGTLAAAITSGATTLTLTSGQGALFPTLGVGDYCWCTLVDTSNNVEIIKVTARSTDTLTMTRGQDNTTAQAFAISDRLELRPTAALFAEFADPAMGGDLTGTASNAQIAANAVGLAEMAGGTDGQVLTSTGAGSPPAFETAAGGGKVLQVVGYSRSDPEYTISTTSYVDMWSQDITPTAAGSKILVITHINQVLAPNDPMNINLERNGTTIHNIKAIGNKNNTTVPFIDTPTYTLGDTITYNTAGSTSGGGGTSYIDHHGSYGFTIMEIGA